MINKLTGHVESVKVIAEIVGGFCECDIQIDFDEYKIFYQRDTILSYVDKDVFYNVRPDVVHGETCQVICEIALVTEVMTVDANKSSKLIPVDSRRPICNFKIKDIKFGEFKPNCIAILTKYTMGHSAKAKWYDCELLDAQSHLFELRLFSPDADPTKPQELMDTLINGYVEFDIESTKYGYQTNELRAIAQKVEASPEVAIAKVVVENTINADGALLQYVTDTKLLQYLDTFIDAEPGYAYVRMASELYLIEALANITNDIDERSMKRAVICSYGYVIPHKDPWARNIVNVTKILKYTELRADETLKSLLDIAYEKECTTSKLLYMAIKNMVSQIIDIRRGIKHEEIDNLINTYRAAFNGML